MSADIDHLRGVRSEVYSMLRNALNNYPEIADWTPDAILSDFRDCTDMLHIPDNLVLAVINEMPQFTKKTKLLDADDLPVSDIKEIFAAWENTDSISGTRESHQSSDQLSEEFPVRLKRTKFIDHIEIQRKKGELFERVVVQRIWIGMHNAPRDGSYIEAWSLTHECWITVQYVEATNYDVFCWREKSDGNRWKTDALTHWRYPNVKDKELPSG